VQIRRLKLLNFKGFASCEVELDPRFNLFVGDNATGKTSFLDALSIALDSWFLGMKGVERPGGIDLNQVRLRQQAYADSVSFEKQFPSRIEAMGVIDGIDLTWSRELSREGGRTTTAESKELSEFAAKIDKRVRDGDAVDLPLICSYGTERLWFESRHSSSSKRGETSRKLPSRFDGYRDCNVFEIQETALLDWIKAEVSVTQQRGTETIALSVAKQAIVDCVEDAKSLYYDERVKDVIVVMAARGPQMFRFLSDGQRIMLTLIGDLVKRAITLNPHLGKDVLKKIRGVVVIDELDLHLHPRWQRRVIRDLKRTFPKIQFVATTHSPQLIGEALPNEIRILENWHAFIPERSFGMDSNRVLEEVMHVSERNEETRRLLSSVSKHIDDENIEAAKAELVEVARELGEGSPEVTGATTLISLLESTR